MSLEPKIKGYAEKPSDFINHENQAVTEIYTNKLHPHNLGFIYHKQERTGHLPEQTITIKENRPELLTFCLNPIGKEYDVDTYVLTNLAERKKSFNTVFWKEFDEESFGYDEICKTTFEKSLWNRKKRPHEVVSFFIDYTYDRFMQHNRVN